MRTRLIGTGVAVLGLVALAVTRNPDSGLRGGRSGRMAAGTTTRAIQFFEAKLAADPIDAGAAGALAGRYVLRFQQTAQLQDLRRAQQSLEGTLVYAADAAAANASLSAVQLMQHDFARAYSSARAAIDAEGTNDDALGAWFDAALATGRFEEAERALGGMESGTLAWRVRRSHWLDANGDTDGAYQSLEPVCEQVERSGARPELTAWCLTELAGLALARTGEQAAERLYRKALGILPEYRGAIEGLADLDHASGRWRSAIRKYERIATDAHPDLYLRLAEANLALGRETRATAWEAEFVRAAGDPAVEALYAQPLALYWAERPEQRDRALDIARRDVARRPAPESWDVLSWVHFRRGELRAALEASDRAGSAVPPSATMTYHRARILEALGQEDEAAALMRTAVELRPQLDPAARLDLDRRSDRI
ncbi:MAG: hypothetical protein ACREL7_00665 [Longimicrobiales bacterium]